jgi:CheY-like chemotaxis protein
MLNWLSKFKQDRVLVVDDEEFCITSLVKLIEKTGFDFKNRLDLRINGKEAFDLVKTSFDNGITYKLILTDFSMPVMDGL